MSRAFKLEDPGEGIHEAEILEVNVSEGDEVAEGDQVMAIETDKAAIELPSPYSGKIAEICVAEGDTVSVGTVLIRYADEDEDAAADDQDDGDERDGKGEKEETEPDRADDETTDETKDEDETDDADAAEEDIEDEAETGEDTEDETEGEGEDESEDETGDDETADKEEVEDETEDETKADGDDEDETEEKTEDETEHETEETDSSGPRPAAPATRRLAKELGVDLSQIDGSGPDGRITEKDVREAARTADKDKAKGESPDFSEWGPVERKPLKSVRRAVARAMAKAWAEIPHVMHQDEVDITELEDLRQRHKDTVEADGGELSLTVILMKAVAGALSQHPRFNASLDSADEAIILKSYCHIGLATDTERGLLVPVIRDVDRKSVRDLALELPELIARARAGKAKRAELRGGSFTITNAGTYGATGFTPIINYPEAAILGIASARWQPVVQGGHAQAAIAPRLILPVCLSFDHRLNDGADAGRFMATFKTIIGDPETFMLSV